MVRTEPKYRPSSSSVACTAAGAEQAKRSLFKASNSSVVSCASKASVERAHTARPILDPTMGAGLVCARWRAGTPRGRTRARQAAPAPSMGLSWCTAAITASRRWCQSSCPARLQVFLDVDHQQRLVQAQFDVVALAVELGDVQRLGAVGVSLEAALDGRQGGQVQPPSAGDARCSASKSTHPRGASARRSRRALYNCPPFAECGACRRWRTCAGALVAALGSWLKAGTLGSRIGRISSRPKGCLRCVRIGRSVDCVHRDLGLLAVRHTYLVTH